MVFKRNKKSLEMKVVAVGVVVLFRTFDEKTREILFEGISYESV